MSITIGEQQLIEVLEECLPYLRFAVGGIDVDETLGKVEFLVEMSRRAQRCLGKGDRNE
jgi:hypothetical protein